jgi:hypothetical protein
MILLTIALMTASHGPHMGTAVSGACIRVTLNELNTSPRRYGGRLVCVEGFLADMIPFGEEITRLTRLPHPLRGAAKVPFLDVRWRWSVVGQARLARFSGSEIVARGIFHFNQSCWARAGAPEPHLACEFPMWLLPASIVTRTGQRF